jgi:LDH2 family malate/lactate/ureidoglycolate dehydrogenase
MQYRFTEGAAGVDPSQGTRHVDAAALQAFTARVFEALGMPAEDAATEAEVLVWANLRGIDSHGVQRVAAYSRAVDNGFMNPRPRIRVERETAATLLMEADHAFGPVVTVQAMERVIAKARAAGIGWGLIRNTAHQGAMAYYAQMAAAADLVGLAVVCSPPNMAPPGAKQAGTHNSPIAVAVPGARRPPISLDMATSVAAGGKLDVALDKGVAIPEEWALDAEGRPTTDPAQAALLRPAAGYKGYGLALVFECLSSLMVGNPLLSTTISGEDAPRRGTQNSFVAAIDIAAFTDVEVFKRDVDRLADAMNGLATVDGAPPVLVPGQPEEQVLAERTAGGIPLPAGTVAKLRAAAERFGLELPPALR